MSLRILRLSAFIVVWSALLALVACNRSDPVCTGTTVQLRQPKTLTVGADFAYPPFAFDGPDGEPTGFEVDLANALAKQIGLKVLLVNRTSAALISGVLAHRHDLAASALRDTDELRSQACLSDPYLEADLGVLALASADVPGVEDLAGARVGVLDGSRAEEWVRAELPDAVLKTMPVTDDLLVALRAKGIDVVIDELPLAKFAREKSKDFKVTEEIDTGENYVLAAGRDNASLIELVNGALLELEETGGLDRLRERWFGA